MTPRCDACGARGAVLTTTPTGDVCDQCLAEQFGELVDQLDDAEQLRAAGGAA